MRWLPNFLGLASVGVFGWLIATEGAGTLAMPAFVLLAVLAVGIVVGSRWPLGAILVLVVGSATPRFAFTVSGLHIRPEHLAIAVVMLALCVQVLRGNIRPTLDLRTYDYFLL